MRTTIQRIHCGETVWVNPFTEDLRKEECLCLNCHNLKLGKDDNCETAKGLYEICREHNVALIITRCPLFDKKVEK